MTIPTKFSAGNSSADTTEGDGRNMLIYAIVNLRTQRAYIGRTAQRPSMRWRQHLSRLRTGTHSARALQTAWDNDGPGWFSFITLEDLGKFATKRDAATRERWHLQSTIDPYNQSASTLSGPEPGVFKHAPASIALMRHAVLGRHLSDDTKRRISEARRGRSYPHKRGYTLSAETRAKMRAAHLGKKGTAESRSKQSAALRGRTFTEEWKAKIRASKSGTPRSAVPVGAREWPINF